MRVWLLMTETKHDRTVDVFASESAATKAARDWVESVAEGPVSDDEFRCVLDEWGDGLEWWHWQDGVAIESRDVLG